MEALNLTFPAQQQGQHLLVETEFEELKLWVDALPYGKMDIALHDVLDKLSKLNRTDLNIKERYNIMELFHTPFRVIHDYYYNSSFFKERGNHTTNSDAPKELRELTKELGFSFKIMAVELSKKRQLIGKNKQLAVAINWAMQYLELYLLDHYIVYEHAPNYLWRELNQLYFYAESKDLHELALPVDKEDFCLETISDTFKRILLIAQCSPYHLESGQLWDVFCYLKHWAVLCKITNNLNESDETCCFLIELDSDHKPVYAQGEEAHDESSARLLLTAKLVEKIKGQLSVLDKKKQLPSPGFHASTNIQTAKKLLSEMQSRWDKEFDRKTTRSESHIQLDFIWGLNSIRQFLEQKVDPDSSHDLPAISESYEPTQPTLPEEYSHWETVNTSKGGLRIHHYATQLVNLSVGQIAVFRYYHSGKPAFRWDIGIIRWLEEDANHGTDIGIEQIKGNIKLASISTNLENSRNAKSSTHAALLVYDLELEEGHNATVIAPPKIYYEGRELLLLEKKDQRFVKARKKISETGQFCRFLVEDYENKELSEAINKVEPINEDEIILDDTYGPDDYSR